MRVSIVVPPAANPDWPSMGAEVIAAVSRRAGHDTTVHYAQLLQPKGDSLEEFSISTAGLFLPRTSGRACHSSPRNWLRLSTLISGYSDPSSVMLGSLLLIT